MNRYVTARDIHMWAHGVVLGVAMGAAVALWMLALERNLSGGGPLCAALAAKEKEE